MFATFETQSNMGACPLEDSLSPEVIQKPKAPGTGEPVNPFGGSKLERRFLRESFGFAAELGCRCP